MENEFVKIAKDFAQDPNVQYVGENNNVVLFQCVVDEDGMGMFIVIPKDTKRPVWTNGFEKKWDNDLNEIMGNLPDGEEDQAMRIMGIKN